MAESNDSDRRCIGCDTPMSHDSVLTAPWEDGDNEYAYVTCSRCGTKNFWYD